MSSVTVTIMEPRKKLGEIFVENKILTPRLVERILIRSKLLNKRFGTVLEDMELITGEELANALAIQYKHKVVKELSNLPFDPELKNIIPLEVAMQNMLFPLKKENGWLALAMADPTETKIVTNIATNNGLKVAPYISSKKDILAAISKYYMGKEPATSDQRTVVIADDDRMMLNMFRDILSAKGYRVVPAVDGMEAYKAVITEKPQVVITDKEMPKLDGYGLLGALKNSPETKFLPVILVTGRAMNPDEESKAFEKGFFDFIAKPVKEVSLITRVNRAFLFHDRQYRLY